MKTSKYKKAQDNKQFRYARYLNRIITALSIAAIIYFFSADDSKESDYLPYVFLVLIASMLLSLWYVFQKRKCPSCNSKMERNVLNSDGFSTTYRHACHKCKISIDTTFLNTDDSVD